MAQDLTRTWLKEKRLTKGLTQKQVAELAGIKRPAYNMIEKGVRRPSPEVAQVIAKELDFQWVVFFPDNTQEETK